MARESLRTVRKYSMLQVDVDAVEKKCLWQDVILKFFENLRDNLKLADL